MADKDDYIGKRLSWNEVVNLFPDLWVTLEDYIYTDKDVINEILEDVIQDKDIDDYMYAHSDEDSFTLRTTEGNFGGYINGVLV